QGLDRGLCRLSAEMFAMLGQDLSSASQELSVMSLSAVWQAAQALQTQYAFRRARMEEDPNKIPELSQEDHAEFRDRFARVHPDVILIDAKEPHKKFVETRADVIVVKSGLSRNAEDLLSISRADQPELVTDVTTLFHRLHAFFMSLEYLNISAFSRTEGPLKYLQELEQFRSECPGLPFPMGADRAIRKKIFRLLSEQRALLEVLNNHKYLWNDARTSVTLSKVEHNRQQFIANPDQVQEEGGHPPIPHNPFKRTLSGVMSGVDVEAIAQGQHKAADERGSAFFAGAYIGMAGSPAWVIVPFVAVVNQGDRPVHHAEGAGGRVHVVRHPPNVVIKLSDFQGGGLWIEDPLGLDPQVIDGRTIQGTNTDFEHDTIVFNAKDPWLGFKPAPAQTGDHADVPWQIPTFALKTEDADRKRPHGAPVRVRDHRQRSSGQKAIAAGYQMNKSVVLPLITAEMHPGEAIEFALDTIHPFTKDAAIDPDLQVVLQEIVDNPAGICDRRASLLPHWDARARALVPESESLLKQILTATFAACCGVFRMINQWRSALSSTWLFGASSCMKLNAPTWTSWTKSWLVCRSSAMSPPLIAGLPIADRKPHAEHLSVDSLHSRAWEFRCKVLSAIRRAPATEHSPKVWEATLEDVEEPFFEESEVSKFVGDDHWIPTQRFEVVQKNKVRGVDSATSNGINMATVVTEKLELPSTDANVAVIKWLRSRLPTNLFVDGFWTNAGHIARCPFLQVAFFVMVGHSFGLVSAVYNYNLRSAAITDILRRVFFVAGFNFYDDKYGFEPEETAARAKVHWWLGARFDQQKLQLCSDPTILGVTYDLEQYLLKIKKSRKKELFDEISMILEHEELSPGQAGKLRGKLMFGASQLWGKIGRAFLRALSDRQYSRKTADTALTPALLYSLYKWRTLVIHGPPRPIPGSGSRRTDVVIFTDGSAPSANPKDPATEMIGGVMFTRED
ncbi:unnamed protein product, partial [Symbiodinium microadriaticum]